MKRGKRGFLFLIIGGMELSWLYAWATFLTISTFHQPFPFREAIGTFGLAAMLTLVSKGKGWRIVCILGLQIFGFMLSALRILYVFNSWPYSFWDHTWLKEFFNTPRNPLDWLLLFLLLFWAILFWTGGLTLVRRPAAYTTICSRFDLGIAAFALLFLTKFLLLAKGGIQIEDHISQLFLFPFFVLSVLAIGLIRNQSTTQRDFLPGYRGIGVILSFIMFVVLFGTGLVLFFSPYLTVAAETGYGVLKTAAKPLAPILVGILRFIFLHGSPQSEKPSPPTNGSVGDSVSPSESSWWIELLEKILTWVFGGVFGLMVLVISGLVLFFLFRWLFSRTPLLQTRQRTSHLILWWVDRLRAFVFSCWKWVMRRGKGHKDAVRLFTALLSWGRHSGLPRFLSETPREYGLRLKNRFPSLEKEIESIIEAFHQEVYGETVLGEQQLIATEFAWHRLRSPRQWPSRLKTWFLQPPHLSEAIQYRALDRNLIL